MPTETYTILIVDDDVGLARLIEKKVRREGLLPVVAHSGHDAITWLQEHQADLMLLDLKLPDLGGKELVSRLSAINRPVPFIIITGQGDERVAVEMMKRGALDYLVKDVQFIEFVPSVIKRALGQVERERKLAAAVEALRRSEANLAKAQQIAHLGSYEIHLPFSPNDYCSEEIFRIIGWHPARKELSTHDYLQKVVHPDDQEQLRQTIAAARPFAIEYRVVRPDGTVRCVQSTGEPVLDAHGKVAKIVGTLLDVTERKQLENALLQISDREQRRIGQDLHDGLGQHLAGIELMSQVLEQKLTAKNMKKEAAHTGEIARYVRDAISQTRLLARGLAPVVLESEGLMSALQDLAASTEHMFRISCEFLCEQPVLFDDHAAALHLYRIAQEAVSNAIRHGKAKKVLIRLQASNRRIVMAVKDDGMGIPKTPGKKGIGLNSMQYRAGMIGGSLVVQSDPDGGTSVVCSLPEPPASTHQIQAGFTKKN